ncbi:phosphotransferase [Cohnella faecalis]|uniref:Phosphotransferase n=2 Tax=Cohnella faecalis TaxID=2315694 RepID=A0A398CQ97_9BACL|nr:phosphotransferase [Cohnella faecalis]
MNSIEMRSIEMKALIDEVVHAYFETPGYEIDSVPFGLTNVTKIVTIEADKYVIRIYNRHTKSVQSLELEAAITSFLSERALSFRVPEFVRSLSGNEYISMSDGTLGAVVTFLKGSAPELSSVRHAVDFGKVVGELSNALEQFEADRLSYRGKSFSEFYGLHPLADRAAVAAFIENPPFPIAEDQLLFYESMVSSIEKSAHLLKDLPTQLVHHDLLIFNLLADENGIRGVLDFDFVSVDARCMELAISLNHVLQMSGGSMEMAEAFVKGYAEQGKCTSPEIERLELLTRIYHIAVLHIYIGQHYSDMTLNEASIT